MDLISQIIVKKQPLPVNFCGTNVRTDSGRAMFPYPNYWVGDYQCPYPIIHSRRGGYQPRIDITLPAREPYRFSCNDRYPHFGTNYQTNKGYGFSDPLPQKCFEHGSTMEWPCHSRPFHTRRMFVTTEDDERVDD